MSAFLDTIKARARQDKKTIVLPESMDARTFEAAEKILKEDIANIVIIGTPEEVEKYLDQRTQLGILEDKMDTYTRMKAADALGDAAKNEGWG